MAKFRNRTIRRTKTSKRKHFKKTLRSKLRRTKGEKYGGNSDTIIIMMWMKNCGYCEKLQEIWPKIKSENKNVKFIDMESSEIDYELLKRYNVESPRGFPTLVKIKNGIVCDEPQSRELNELRTWIKS